MIRRIAALAIAFIVLGFAFAAAQDETQPLAAKAAVKKALKSKGELTENKLQPKLVFRHRVNTAFLDEDCDGINDLAKDADGDGIPNGEDEDWAPPQDGTGYKEQVRKGNGTTEASVASGYSYSNVRDDDGDGIPNGQDDDYVKPQDGTGYKDQHKIGKDSFRKTVTSPARQSGAGDCDGTGPKGATQRKGRG